MPKSRTKADVDENLVRKLADLLEETGLTEIEYGTKDWHLRVARGTSPSTGGTGANPAAATVAETAAAPETAERVADHPGVVTAPMVGVVYTAPEPDEPPFVKVGDTVGEGQTLLLIEAMKVFNPITAPRAGKVARILIGSGTPVEFGEPLLIIE
ncbi:MAG: acetyl-CoA carboxylase biotin carboxyl carrier protein [Rhodospirillales bacterium]